MQEKRCSSCERTFPLDDFYIRSDTGRHGTECRHCKIARGRERYRVKRAEHAATVKRRYDTFGRFDRYHITAERYDEMLAEQNGKCGLCECSEPGGKGKWHIDHPHAAGQTYHGFKAAGGPVRGLLCHRCNVALGHYENLLERVGEQRVRNWLAKG